MKLLFFALALMFVTFSDAKAQDQATVVASCGTANLTAGTQAFRTVDVNGVTCSGAGSASTSVWSASDAAANGMTLSNGGLTVVGLSTATWKSIRSTISQSSGKLYVEFLNTTVMTGSNVVFGFASSGFNASGLLGSSAYSAGVALNAGGVLVSAGFSVNYNPYPSAFVPAQNEVFGMAVDFTAGKIWISRNNIWVNSSNPATGSSPVVSFIPATVGALFPALTLNESNTLIALQPADAQPKAGNPVSGVWTLQPTAASQKYAPPAGFSPWN